MNFRFTLLAVLSLFGILTLRVVHAQSSDAVKRNCTPPSPIHQVDPPLPGHFGATAPTLSVSIDEKGRVTAANVLKSSGDDKFDNGALKAVKRWKFKPALCDGKPSPVHISVEIR